MIRPTRRDLLAGGLAAALLPRLAFAASRAEPLFLSARADDSGVRYFASLFDAAGRGRLDLPLPDRGHGAALDPTGGTAVLFARRPGTFAVVLDVRHPAFRRQIESPAGRHFSGHGVFSADGRTLFATETDFERDRGVIGVYDAGAGFRRLGEFDSGGLDPHELLWLSDRRTLVIANGGILTRPEFPRAKLNLPAMESSLAYLDPAGGRVLEQVGLPWALHQVSLRHLAVTADDEVAVVCQHEGLALDRVPLVFLHRRGGALRPLDAPPGRFEALGNYVGSAVFDESGSVLAISCPRGSRVLFWERATGAFLGEAAVPDGCGIAALPGGGFLATSGLGGARRLSAAGSPEGRLESPFLLAGRWDNHLLGL